jgi:hypothetical protein
MFAEIENLAHFAAGDFADAGKIKCEDVHALCGMADAGRVVESATQ